MVKKVAQAAAAKPALTPLAEHDAERNKAWTKMLGPSVVLGTPNGIACPHCGAEMIDLGALPFIARTFPPNVTIRCPVCDWRGGRVA